MTPNDLFDWTISGAFSCVVAVWLLQWLRGKLPARPRCKLGEHRFEARHHREPITGAQLDHYAKVAHEMSYFPAARANELHKLLNMCDRATYVADVCQDCGLTTSTKEDVKLGLELLAAKRKQDEADALAAKRVEEEIGRLLRDGTW